MEDHIIEHRTSQRAVIEEFGIITLENDPESFDCYIYNISEGGIMLYVNHEFKVNDTLHLTLTIQDRVIKRNCIVKGCKDFTKNQKYAMQIGKSLNVSQRINAMFTERLSKSEFEFIRMNH